MFSFTGHVKKKNNAPVFVERYSPMKKPRRRLCQNCGSVLPPGKDLCSCGRWNTDPDLARDATVLLSEVSEEGYTRYETGPWDPCFGGGIVRGSVTLLGGEPGAGKSTLSLQLSSALGSRGEVLYVAAEEDEIAVKQRATRLKVENLQCIRLLPAMGAGVDLGPIMMARRPKAVVLDSLPGLVGGDSEGAVQMAQRIKAYAVELGAPVLIIDHVTKRDEFAGEMALQHAVDTTITLF